MDENWKCDNFIRVVPSKDKKWINDVYYGIKGADEHGHLLLSGSLVIKNAFVVNETITNFSCEEVLYHRDIKGKVLLDTGIKR